MAFCVNSGPKGDNRAPVPGFRQASTARRGGSAGFATIPPETCDMFCSQVHKMVRLPQASARSRLRCRLLRKPMTDPSTRAP